MFSKFSHVMVYVNDLNRAITVVYEHPGIYDTVCGDSALCVAASSGVEVSA